MRDRTGSGELLLGIDVGTSSVRACIFSPAGALLGIGRAPYAIRRPQPGWAEVDADQWWEGFVQALSDAVRDAGIEPGRIRGVGLSTLFPALIALDARGRALRPAILYCDQRATRQVEDLLRSGCAETLEKRTGNRVTPGTCALTSLLWLRDEEREVYERASWFGTVNTLFSLRLAGVPAADYTSGLLFGLADARDPATWSEELAAVAGVSPDKLPSLHAPGARVGGVTREAARVTGLGEGVPVAAGAGDAAAAPFGGGCTSPGNLLYTTGSSDCVSVVVDSPPASRLVANTGYLNDATWLSIGTATSTGAAVDWFARQFLGEDSGAAVARDAAASVPGARGVTFLPYLQGERTPIWDPSARGLFSGLSLGSSRADLARAVLEGTAFAFRQVVETVERETGIRIGEVPTAGGGARNELWNRIKADVTGRPLCVFEFQEFSALGAAMLAGLAAGVYRSPEQAAALTEPARTMRTVEPERSASDAYEEAYRRYVRLQQAGQSL